MKGNNDMTSLNHYNLSYSNRYPYDVIYYEQSKKLYSTAFILY